MKTLPVLVLVALAAVMALVRLAPSDPDRWHVDPLTAPDPGRKGVRLAPPDAPAFDAAPDVVMAVLDRIATATPRVTRLAGDVAGGHVTYVARSRVWGFPDYVSVRAVADPEGGPTTLAVLSRLRFGGSDHGVNRARVERWLGELQDLLAP